jgi:solute:Na+ symporter, SSS family
MHLLDWLVLIGTLLAIVLYGVLKNRKQKNLNSYLLGDQNLPWWTIGISVMATQASAVTFLSTPGQGFDDGLRFIQFYFGMPLAVVVVAFVIIPLFYKQKVYTAYAFLEQSFGPKTRTYTAFLFLVQRGLAAGITIYAPSIVLSTVLDIPLHLTNIVIGVLVTLYTVSGGSKAVAQTQKWQMLVMMGGLFVAAGVLLFQIQEKMPLQNAFTLAEASGKFNAIQWTWDWDDRYNVWSGLLGGFFLSLAYFGTDQSQVGRYLGGKDIRSAKIGLLFNGVFKIPMQLFILFIGVLVFIFFTLTPGPLHFNQENYEASEIKEDKVAWDASYQSLLEERNTFVENVANGVPTTLWQEDWQAHLKEEKALRESVRETIKAKVPNAEPNDRDYVFLHFIMHYLPTGLVGLLLAMIFSGAMSSTSSELNALGSVTVVDMLRHVKYLQNNDHAQLQFTRWATTLWGLAAIGFAAVFSLFDNLIQAVNILGSLFYGPMLGIFLTAFFLPRIPDRTMLLVAILGEVVVLSFFFMDQYDVIQLAWLWLNPLGCLSVMLFAWLGWAASKTKTSTAS